MKDIQYFDNVKESYPHGWSNAHGYTNFTIVVPTGSASTRRMYPRGPYRYHVYRIDSMNNIIRMIGNELDIYGARAIARRMMVRDGEPLTAQELTIGRWPRQLWADSVNLR